MLNFGGVIVGLVIFEAGFINQYQSLSPSLISFSLGRARIVVECHERHKKRFKLGTPYQSIRVLGGLLEGNQQICLPSFSETLNRLLSVLKTPHTQHLATHSGNLHKSQCPKECVAVCCW